VTRVRGEERVAGLRALGVGLALWVLLAFAIVDVAECAAAAGAGSHGTAAAFHNTAEHSHSESAGVRPVGHRCHHDVDHQHMGAAGKLYAAPRRLADHQSTDPAGSNAADWSAASALVLLGIQRRGPPLSVPRSSPSGRHILISTCVARR